MNRKYRVLGIILVVVVTTLSSLALALRHDSPCGAGKPPPAGSATMHAVVYRCYGAPDVVKQEELPWPAAADDRIVVKVKAAAMNALDWHYMRGKPYIMRALGVGWGAPQDIRLGVDFAGTVESFGKNVTRFKRGDEVFGGGDGSFASYISVREHGAVALKPAALSFAQAAAAPVAAVTALQALRDKGKLQPGQQVLINGATGGVGTYAVQIAKALGAEVTAVCSTNNLALVRSIGADHVVDYTHEDFTQGERRYDLIIDNVATHSLSDYRRVLRPKGAVVMVGMQQSDPWMMAMAVRSLQAVVLSSFGSQKFLFILAQLNENSVGDVRAMLDSGKVTPVIDRTYALAEVPAAMRYLEQGHARGKVVISVE